jgi:hypothetical protein
MTSKRVRFNKDEEDNNEDDPDDQEEEAQPEEDDENDDDDEDEGDEDEDDQAAEDKKKQQKKKKTTTTTAQPAGEDGELEAEDAERREKQKMSALLNALTPEQLKRYEHFRRSHFRRSEVSKIMLLATGNKDAKTKPSERMTIVVGGAAKMFAGELVELAKKIAEERGSSTTSIQPSHLREAHRRLRRAGRVPKRVNLN